MRLSWTNSSNLVLDTRQKVPGGGPGITRPLGDVIYFMPPYVITPEEINYMTDVARQAIGAATQD